MPDSVGRDPVSQYLAAGYFLTLAKALQNWGSLKDKASSLLGHEHPAVDSFHLVYLHDENDGNGDKRRPMIFGFSWGIFKISHFYQQTPKNKKREGVFLLLPV
ncbi:MAG: hypothetical protein ACFCU8_17960 [Thermosynechococcaceae cyanobacterium]